MSTSPGTTRRCGSSWPTCTRGRVGRAAAAEAVRRFLETNPPGPTRLEAWRRLRGLARTAGAWLDEVQALVEIASAPESTIQEASDAAGSINHLLYERDGPLDPLQKEVLIRRPAEALLGRLDHMDAAACSRLAWLLIHLGDEDGAARVTDRGLQLDPSDLHCQKLAGRLGVTQS